MEFHPEVLQQSPDVIRFLVVNHRWTKDQTRLVWKAVATKCPFSNNHPFTTTTFFQRLHFSSHYSNQPLSLAGGGYARQLCLTKSQGGDVYSLGDLYVSQRCSSITFFYYADQNRRRDYTIIYHICLGAQLLQLVKVFRGDIVFLFYYPLPSLSTLEI